MAFLMALTGCASSIYPDISKQPIMASRLEPYISKDGKKGFEFIVNGASGVVSEEDLAGLHERSLGTALARRHFCLAGYDIQKTEDAPSTGKFYQKTYLGICK